MQAPAKARYHEALRKRLPYEVIPTNIEGAFASPAPPENFDPKSASAASLITLGGGSRSRTGRGQPARRGRPLGQGDATAPRKRTLRFWPLPQPRLSLGFVAGQASKSSSATTRKKVVLHSARGDPPTVCHRG